MPSGKRRLHFVSGRRNDDCLRNASEVFRKGIHSFLSFPIFTDLYLHLMEIAEVHYTFVHLLTSYLEKDCKECG